MSDRTRLGGVVVLIALVLVGAAAGSPWSYERPAWFLPPDDSDVPPPEAPAPVDGPTYVDTLPPGLDDQAVGMTISDYMTYLGLAVAAVLIVVTILYLRRRRNEPDEPGEAHDDHVATGDAVTADPTPEIQLPALRRGVTHARHLLDTARTPRDAVTAAWIALEDATADTGHRRHPAQTPTEFTTTVLDATPADPDAVTTLLRLYQRARFTDHPLTDHDVETARDCLERLTIAFAPPPEPADAGTAHPGPAPHHHGQATTP
ncbi:DUF4129 domain-containing protein [Oerskovia enterophila]|uniref:Protein-glutamine gamma-glutamyltransferase-like C-terminal domain-containing protein n=1 Tax=Oerskovia enterophila TaxID=43678 RepID=A0A161YK90_9CELL|nr:DUF4129 domain-containing protein [Oerskovia enterophila]KZM36838.1 hypothetical protein OJAG_04750 [Oerskovia enterophila]